MLNKPLAAYTEEELIQELSNRRAQQGAKTLWDLEDALEQTQAKEHEETVKRYLEGQGHLETNDPKPCPQCGRLIRVRAKERERRVRTQSGEVSFRRNYHFCEDCHFGFYPKDVELGLPQEGEVSAKLEQKILDFGVNTPYEEAAQRWSVHYPVPVSEKLIRSVVERRGEAWGNLEAEKRQDGLCRNKKPPSSVLVVQIDGSMISTREAGWKEAKVAVLYREENHTKEQGTGRGFVSEARYVATMEGPGSFEREVKEALCAEQAQEAKEVVFVGDGAQSNWNLCQTLCPKAVQVLDVMHAVEHGMQCGKGVLGEDKVLLSLWEKRLKQLLYEGSPKQLLQEIGDCLWRSRGKSNKALLSLYSYYHTNQRRMKYREYQEAGYPIGSGTVESAHRHVLQSRMKRAGQHWNRRRAHQMASLRAAYKTVGPKRFYETIRKAA